MAMELKSQLEGGANAFKRRHLLRRLAKARGRHAMVLCLHPCLSCSRAIQHPIYDGATTVEFRGRALHDEGVWT
jgi:hypothetical protein